MLVGAGLCKIKCGKTGVGQMGLSFIFIVVITYVIFFLFNSRNIYVVGHCF